MLTRIERQVMTRSVVDLASYRTAITQSGARYRRNFSRHIDNSQPAEILLFDGIRIERYDYPCATGKYITMAIPKMLNAANLH